MAKIILENETGMSVYIDTILYRKFKAQVIMEGKTIRDVITDFIKTYCEEDSINGEKDKKHSKQDEKKP